MFHWHSKISNYKQRFPDIASTAPCIIFWLGIVLFSGEKNDERILYSINYTVVYTVYPVMASRRVRVELCRYSHLKNTKIYKKIKVEKGSNYFTSKSKIDL